MNNLIRTTVNNLLRQARPYHTIQAIPREVFGSRISARDRAQGRIPAVVFTPSWSSSSSSSTEVSRKQLLTTERKQIKCLIKDVGLDFFCSTRFKIHVRAGSGSNVLLSTGHVIPVKLHREAETGKMLNLVLAWADDGSHIEVDVPVVYKGNDSCPGLQKGGKLKPIRPRLKFLCPAERIPPKIEVDISNLDVGDRIFLKDIQVDPSLKLLTGKDTRPVCYIAALETKNLKQTKNPKQTKKPKQTKNPKPLPA